MKLVIQFLATLALGAFLVAIYAVTGPSWLPEWAARFQPEKLEYASVGFGLAMGVVVSGVTRLPWLEIPRQAIGFVVSQGNTLKMMALGALLAAILMLY